MTLDEIMAWLEAEADPAEREGLARYGIPTDRAYGIPMRALKAMGRRVGPSHELALELWDTGWYEARTLAVFVDVAAEVSPAQMDAWARDFDSWAICDTTCFHLFDRTPQAWDKAREWTRSEAEFVRRGAFALVWALSVHDKAADDERFLRALEWMHDASTDDRPLVRKAVDMALRATGKRNRALNRAAVAAAERMAESEDGNRAWIGRHSLRELTSAKIAARLASSRAGG